MSLKFRRRPSSGTFSTTRRPFICSSFLRPLVRSFAQGSAILDVDRQGMRSPDTPQVCWVNPSQGAAQEDSGSIQRCTKRWAPGCMKLDEKVAFCLPSSPFSAPLALYLVSIEPLSNLFIFLHPVLPLDERTSELGTRMWSLHLVVSRLSLPCRCQMSVQKIPCNNSSMLLLMVRCSLWFQITLVMIELSDGKIDWILVQLSIFPIIVQFLDRPN